MMGSNTDGSGGVILVLSIILTDAEPLTARLASSSRTGVVQFTPRCHMRDFVLPLVLILAVVAGIWIHFTLSTTHAGPVRAVEPTSADVATTPPPKPPPQHKRQVARSQ